MTDRVLVIGGYGVFGGKLCQALAALPDCDVIVAGRSLAKAQAFCDRHGGIAMAVDRAAPDLAARIARAAPCVVIDAAGPFQSYGKAPYNVARAALACGAHYADLSDDAAFSAGISMLDAQARAKGLAVISGASSVPGLSSAAVTDLAADFTEVLRIDSAILPGNRAPRGLSVMRAILAQAGQPMTIHRGGHAVSVSGWSAARRETLAVADLAPLRRWASYIGAPDLQLFPAHFNARAVTFRAGLELPILHFSLWALSLPVRRGLLRSLEPYARPLRRIAQAFEPFGSDRGGMVVRVLGRKAGDLCERRIWTLIAEAGDGPHIPALAARIICAKALAGTLPPGARPCLGAFDLQDITQMAKGLAVATETSQEVVTPLYRQALGPAFDTLPAPVRALHETVDDTLWHGTAEVQTGRSPLAAVVRRLVGFPRSGTAVPVRVAIRRDGDREIWLRDFGGKRFHSKMTLAGPAGAGRVAERFGPFRFVIALQPRADGLGFPVVGGWFLGLPLPRRLLPTSDTQESGNDGRFRFDVSIRLPLAGLVVRYRGDLRTAK